MNVARKALRQGTHQIRPATHQVQIQSTDPSQNTTQKTYSVTVGGVERTLTYDTNGNLIRRY